LQKLIFFKPRIVYIIATKNNNLNKLITMTQFTDALLAAFKNGTHMFPDFNQKVDNEVEQLYSELSALVTDETELVDAHMSVTGLFEFLCREFKDSNVTPVYAPMPKTFERYSSKLGMTSRPDRYFKTVCDISRLRLLTEDVVGSAGAICAKLQVFVTQTGGAYAVRPTWQNQPDLVQYIYVYTPGGYVCEVQVIHPFAAKVFKADSERRDGDMSSPDYWANDFYSTVKSCIIDDGMTMTQMQGTFIGSHQHMKLFSAGRNCILAGSLTLAQIIEVFSA
jgi:hypothetical protein